MWNKKGMEFWQLVLIVLAVLIMLFFIVFYNQLGDKLREIIGGFF